ncbi:MAG: DUF5615 family PIN-like protein [Dehalococcoidia bacterium]
MKSGPTLTEQGFEVRTWRSFANPSADDSEIMDWAAVHGYVVITQDLDLGQILAAGQLRIPSVVIIRARNARPHQSPAELAWVLRNWQLALEEGALLVVDPDNHRIRALPLR